MRKYALLIVWVGAALAGAQVRMEITIAGRPAGTATLTQKISAEGVKSVQLSMQLVAPERTVKVRTESTYRADGSPIRKFQETTVVGQRYRRQIIVSFSKTEATIVTDLNGDRQAQHLPVPAGARLDNASEFWFIQKMPETGATVESTTLDLEKLIWEKVSIQYMGKKEIKVGGRTVSVHLAKSTKGSAYFDDSGLPVRLELSNARFDRIWEK